MCGTNVRDNWTRRCKAGWKCHADVLYHNSVQKMPNGTTSTPKITAEPMNIELRRKVMEDTNTTHGETTTSTSRQTTNMSTTVPLVTKKYVVGYNGTCRPELSTYVAFVS